MVSLTYTNHPWISVPVIGTHCVQRWHNRFSQAFTQPICGEPSGKTWIHIHGPLPLLTEKTLNLALDSLANAEMVFIALGNSPFGVFAGKLPPQKPLDQWPSMCMRLIGDPLEITSLDSNRSRSAITQMEHHRKRSELARREVFFHDLDSVYLDDLVSIADGCEIAPHVTLRGQTCIEGGCLIGFGSQITDCDIAEEVTIKPYSVLESAIVGKGATIGPFAHIRPKTKLGANTRIGNFVETKNVDFGNGSKASHLAYLGDATIGQDCNIGAGVITCNYDGFNKHRTEIGDRVFVGSDSQLVAPVKVGSDSFVAAGSSITFDVPEQSLGVARSRQVNKEGLAESIRDRARKLKEENSKKS